MHFQLLRCGLDQADDRGDTGGPENKQTKKENNHSLGVGQITYMIDVCGCCFDGEITGN